MKKLLGICALAAAFVSASAGATTFGFAADTGGIFISQGYQGFNYSGGYGDSSWVNDTFAPIDDGYGVGPTLLGAAWSNGGTNWSMTSADPDATFDVASVSLNAGGTENVTVQGLLNGLLINSWTGEIANSYTYTNVSLNWTGIDELTFSSGANLFVTDIDLGRGNNVPEPVSVALLGLGLTALGAARRRKVQ